MFFTTMLPLTVCVCLHLLLHSVLWKQSYIGLRHGPLYILQRNLHNILQKYVRVIPKRERLTAKYAQMRSDYCGNLIDDSSYFDAELVQRVPHNLTTACPDISRHATFHPNHCTLFCRAMHKRGLCRHAVSVCPSVFHVNADHVKRNKDIFQIFIPSGIHTLVFPYQTGWRYSDGNPRRLTGRRIQVG